MGCCCQWAISSTSQFLLPVATSALEREPEGLWEEWSLPFHSLEPSSTTAWERPDQDPGRYASLSPISLSQDRLHLKGQRASLTPYQTTSKSVSPSRQPAGHSLW